MFSKQARASKIAVIGLGVMGRPIAVHLTRAGFDVTGHTRSPAKLGNTPFPLAPTARDAIEAADVVLLAVPALDDVDEALGRTCEVVASARDDVDEALGRTRHVYGSALEDEALERSHDGFASPLAGKTVVLLATVDPAGSGALGEALAAAGATYVEAPVAGSAAQAEDASLLVLASADDAQTVERLQPVFAAFAKKTTWCGPSPNAMTIKLANNLVQIGLFEALAEATRLVERSGLELALFYDVLNSGAMANRVLDAKTAKILEDDLSAQAPLKHVSKDIGLIADRAARLGLDLPGAKACNGTFARAHAAGLGELDAMAIMRVLRS